MSTGAALRPASRLQLSTQQMLAAVVIIIYILTVPVQTWQLVEVPVVNEQKDTRLCGIEHSSWWKLKS